MHDEFKPSELEPGAPGRGFSRPPLSTASAAMETGESSPGEAAGEEGFDAHANPTEPKTIEGATVIQKPGQQQFDAPPETHEEPHEPESLSGIAPTIIEDNADYGTDGD